MNYTVVIAERKEPDLKATVADIEEKTGAKVIVLHDNRGKGPQRMRHEGIMQAPPGVVIVMDGHMRVQPGALDIVAESVKHGKAVACARCHHHHEITFEGSGYAGAKVCWKSEEPGSQYWALSGKWRTVGDAGPIGCVMGACYAFDRDWYIDGLGKPWQFGTGWGMDEEVLSITNWLSGGETILADAHVWHRARVPADVPYSLNPLQSAGLWANRFRILDMLPMHQEDRKELCDHMTHNRFGADMWRLIRRSLEKYDEQVSAYRERKWERTWQDWKETWLEKEAQPTTLMQMRKNIRSRTGAKWHDLMKLKRAELEDIWSGKASAPEPKKKPAKPKGKKGRPLIEVKDPGYPCPHCGHRYGHIKKGKPLPNGRQVMTCGNPSIVRNPDGSERYRCRRNFARIKTHT